jgi:hypothetical protein
MGVAVVPSSPPLGTLGGRLRTGLGGAAVTVAADRFVGGQFLQPVLVIGVQAPFIVVDGHAGGDGPRLEQPQLNPTSTAEKRLDTHATLCYT